MYRLFIEITKDDIRELELPNNFSISFNYSQTDYSNPQVVKVGYSTSVNIEGTPNNNNVFNNIYEVSSFYKYTADNETIKNVNPNLRLTYKLYYNSIEVSAGYMKINKITNNYNKIVYNITLYDEIGSYLYNAMYNSDGSLKTLADLNYGLTNEDETLTYDHHYMLQSWSTLMGDTKVKGPNNEQYDLNGKLPAELKNSLQSLIVPIPCYSGMYDNFDNNKILVSSTDENGNVTMLDPYTYDKTTKSYTYRQTPLKNELRNYINEDKTYDTYGGWELFETERDLMNFEVPELIANRTPLGVNLGKTFRTICDSANISTENIEDSIKTLDKTYFMLKDIPQTYGNISESDKQFYPSELNLMSPYTKFTTSDTINFKGHDNLTEVISTETIKGGENAHIKLSPSYLIKPYFATWPGTTETLNSVYGCTFSDDENSWRFGYTVSGIGVNTSIYTDCTFTISVIYYIVKLEDKTSGEFRETIYPIITGGLKNYIPNVLTDEDVKTWMQLIVKFRTENIFFGRKWEIGEAPIPSNYTIDYRYLTTTWSKNNAKDKSEGFEFIRNEIDIFQKGFEHDYDLTISAKCVTMLNPCSRKFFGLTSNEVDSFYIPLFGVRYWDFRNILYGAAKVDVNDVYAKSNRIKFISSPPLQTPTSYKYLFFEQTNSEGTGFNDISDVKRYNYYGIGQIQTGYYTLNLDGLYMQGGETTDSFLAANLNTNFKVSTYVGSEDITLATISKDILKQVNVKDIFLNTLKMLNLTIFSYIDQKDEVQIYDNGEYVTSITWRDFVKRKDQYSKGTTFKLLFNDIGFLNDKFEWFVPYDKSGLPTDLEIIDINNRIDRNSIEIVPSVLESCEYDYNLNPIESYTNEIKQYHDKDYQKRKNIYKYEHNTSIIDSLKDVTFKTALDYKLKSVWFNDNMISGDTYHQYSAFNKGAQFTQTLFNTSGEELSSVQVQNSGALYALKNLEISQYVEDTSSRLCMFNKDNSMSDFEKCLVCYNGFEERKMPITVTDDIPAAQQINNNFCYVLYPRRGNTTNRGKVVWDVNLGLLKDANDVYFELLNVPLFSNNIGDTVLGYTNLDKEDEYTNLYDLYFNEYNKVFFGESLKKVTCNVKFDEIAKYDILSSIYYFDNSYWVINKLINFNLEKEFNKVELIQIDYKALISIINNKTKPKIEQN